MPSIKIYGSMGKALKVLFASLVMGLLSFAIWHIAPGAHPSLKELIFLPVVKFGFPILVFLISLLPIRTLIFSTPLLEVSTEGLKTRTLFGFRFIPWAQVTGVKKEAIKIGKSAVATLKFTTTTRPIVIPESLLEFSIDDLVKKLSEFSEFTSRTTGFIIAEDVQGKGEFAALAQEMKGKSKKMGWFGRSALQLAYLAAIFAVVFTFNLIKNLQANRPENWGVAFKERAVPVLCGAQNKIFQVCFSFSENECKASMGNAVDECSAEVMSKLSKASKVQEFGNSMAICAPRRYVTSNSLRMIKRADCETLGLAMANIKESDLVAGEAAARTNKISRSLVFSSIRIGEKQALCQQSGFLGKCANNISVPQCESYLQQAADDCEKTIGSSLPLELPESQKDAALKQLGGCIGNSLLKGMRERKELKPECLRGVASEK